MSKNRAKPTLRLVLTHQQPATSPLTGGLSVWLSKIIFISFLLLYFAVPQQTLAVSSVYQTGGTAYSVYDLGPYLNTPTEANWPAVKFVLSQYHLNPSLVNSQLQSMCNAGQKKIALTLWHMSANQDDSFASSTGGKPSAQIENNIRTVITNLSALKNARGENCFDELQFRFAPIGGNHPGEWNNWNESLYQENKNFLFYVRRIVLDSLNHQSLPAYFDLGVELGGGNGGQNPAYTAQLWRDYTSTYGKSDTYGYSVAVTSGAITRLIQVYKSVGLLPDQYAIDIYNTTGDSLKTILSMVKEELQQQGELGKPVLIQETYQDNLQGFKDIFTAIGEGLKVRAVMQWQLTTGNFYRQDGSIRHFSQINSNYLYADFSPQTLTAGCQSGNTQAILSWQGKSVTSSYYFRLDEIANNNSSCQYGWFCPNSTDLLSTITSNTLTVHIKPNTDYKYWVHAITDAGTSQPSTFTFNCQANNTSPADFNQDGVVNLDDYQQLKTNFGNPYTLFDFNRFITYYNK